MYGQNGFWAGQRKNNFFSFSSFLTLKKIKEFIPPDAGSNILG